MSKTVHTTTPLTTDLIEKMAVSALEDIKGKDIRVMDVSRLTPMFERIIVATGDSNRQVKSLARNVLETLRDAGASVVGMEGEDTGEWVLVDFGSVVVHVMQPAVRAYYNLEELWESPMGRR